MSSDSDRKPMHKIFKKPVTISVSDEETLLTRTSTPAEHEETSVNINALSVSENNSESEYSGLSEIESEASSIESVTSDDSQEFQEYRSKPLWNNNQLTLNKRNINYDYLEPRRSSRGATKVDYSGSTFSDDSSSPKGNKRMRIRNTENDLNDSGMRRFSNRNSKVVDYGDTLVEDEDLESSLEEIEAQEAEEDDSPNIDYVVDIRKIERENVESGIGAFEFWIKWKSKSYLHNSWHSYASLISTRGIKKVENYFKHYERDQKQVATLSPEELEIRNINIEMEKELSKQHFRVERILDVTEEDGDTYYFCKWTGLAYSESTWELNSDILPENQAEIDNFLERNSSSTLPSNSTHYSTQNRPMFQKFSAQPPYLVGGELRPYQIEGLNWMAYSWSIGNNVILADEMGLGKTIQSISLVSLLFHKYDVYGPFLIVVPLSTIAAWKKELHKWAPQLNSIIYIGNTESREIIRENEFYVDSTRKIKFNVLVTTYELLLKDQDLLRGQKWAGLLVDEAHRLKNAESQLHECMKDFKTGFRLLITGTPLQNSTRELWALLSFLMPKKFGSVEEFEENYSRITETDQVNSLHAILKPHLLRRLKKDVEKSMPGKSERILRVEMTEMQKNLYKWILTKNFKELNKGSQGKQSTLLNIMTELKKASNHAFLFDNDQIKDRNSLNSIISNSGKMVLLDKLLVRLKSSGHRVLIFSQMVRMLDILNDYMSLRKFQFQRLDGSTPAEERKRAIDHFNAPNSVDFCFLLSTKAGGLGINLETADTVIIFDSDWNPQNDLQAMARAHRIGQKNTVNIYRFVSESTVEENILERAKQKMVLDHLVIQQMDTSGRTVLSSGKSKSKPAFNREEMNEIMKFGAQDLFKSDENQKKADLEIDLDMILARAEHHDSAEQNANSKHSELLDQFQVANFGAQVNWDEIIPKEEIDRMATEELLKTEAELYFSKRRRKAAMAKREHSPNHHIDKVTTDTLNKKVKKKAKQTEHYSEKALKSLHRSILRFGSPDTECKRIAADSGYSEALVVEIGKKLIESCVEAENKIKEQIASSSIATKAVMTDFHELKGINATQLLQRIAELESLREKVHPFKRNLPQFRIVARVKPVVKWASDWTLVDDSMLMIGIYKHGFGCWEKIQQDEELKLQDKIFSNSDDQKRLPRFSHLSRRSEYLLKTLAETTDQPKLNISKSKKAKSSLAQNSKDLDSPKSEVASVSTSVGSKKKSSTKKLLLPVRSHLENLLAVADEKDEKKCVQVTSESILKIGKHINQVVSEDSSVDKAQLWKFVTRVFPNKISTEDLMKLYESIESIKFVPQQQAWVVERFGKFSRILEPGLAILIPFVETIRYVKTLKEVAVEIPSQSAITQDNVTLHIDGVLYYKVVDPYKASYGVEDADFSITQLAQTTMRSEIGQLTLDRTLAERNLLNLNIVEQINHASNHWGIECLRYEIRDIQPPELVVKSMHSQVSAERQKRAIVLESEGSKQSAINVAEGKKQATILNSEAERAEQINKAEGEARAVLLKAEATAKSVEQISKAIQEAGGSDAVSMIVAQKYIEAFSNLAKESNTLMLPTNVAEPTSMIGQAMSIYNKLQNSNTSYSKK